MSVVGGLHNFRDTGGTACAREVKPAPECSTAPTRWAR